MYNPDYTREITPAHSETETSMEVKDDDYHLTDNVGAADDFYHSSDDSGSSGILPSNIIPSPELTREEAAREEAEYLLARAEYKGAFPSDLEDDISPNATSMADEEDKRSNTPGVSDEVLKLNLEENAPNDPYMDLDDEVQIIEHDDDDERESTRTVQRDCANTNSERDGS